MSNKISPAKRILPVLDLLRGRVVHAVAGERDVYQPVVSELVDSSEPGEVAAAFRERFGFSEIYVADLDAIAGAAPDGDSLRAIERAGMKLWLDAGLRTSDQAALLSHQSSLASVVVGLETVSGLGELKKIVECIGSERLVFSLDLKAGRPIVSHDDWQGSTPEQVLETVLELGIRRFLILDLSRVGTGHGTGTESICQTLRAMSAKLEISVGGGVSDIEDVHQLWQAGCDVVLVASAFHSGRITRKDLSLRRE